MSTILIVDDEPDTLVVLDWLLCAEGFDVQTAAEGAQAWATFQDRHPDLVITDYMMPRMDGLELARRIRASAGPRVPIILASAAAKLPPPDAGEYDVAIRKPIDFTALVDAIKQLLASPPAR
ncbi:MAG: response regulator [Acidobacteria bacterium]|nr:response regulator [Acidobacteriota bacterium]